MIDYERLGLFYLGREYDAGARARTAVPVLYDSKDLVTHALIVGMTGSGKTGLGIGLIEEAAIDGVPTVVIDPKGDLSNLLLTFPQLQPADLEPWVDEDDARRAGKSRQEFAAAEAERWRAGLKEWDQDPARIARLRAAVDWTIYTPGASIAAPVSMLGSFAPDAAADADTQRERVQAVVSSLLTLAGIESDAMTGREHILLSSILATAWQSGHTLDLAALVHQVQSPPMTRIGVIELDAFYPPDERFKLAMALNALLASPGFEIWTRGEPLDVASLLRTAEGKPRVAIFSIAHLDDAYRMFFVSMLLTAITGWMRGQSGTSSLRALVYMDEIFGFFPPVANPPSKAPLLTLLKQGRAAGLGVVLATQNPVDLDYKGLSNIGTWWIGRLQTDRDKARVLDGLESAGEGAFDRAEMDRLLSALTSRVFVMRNVHDAAITVFESRWALSYLRGPLGRGDLRRLAEQHAPPALPQDDPPVTASRPHPPSAATPAATSRPVLPPDVPQFFAPGAPTGAVLRPVLYAAVDVRTAERRLKLDTTRTLAVCTAIGDAPLPVDWAAAEDVPFGPDMLMRDPPADARYEALPPAAAKAKQYAAWQRQLVDWICANESVELLVSTTTKQVSTPGESERDFRARLQQHAREARDAAVDGLRRRYAPKMAALDERRRRAEQTVAREREQASGQRLQNYISLGATLAGALFGRKTASASTLGRATTAARGLGRTAKEAKDVERAAETVAAIEQQRADLEAKLAAEVAALEAKYDAGQEPLERVTVKPKKAGITVKVMALVWQPRT